MTLVRLSVLCLLLATVPAAAQLSPPPGNLKLPEPHSASPPANAPANTQPAPVAPVEQVAPFASPPLQPPRLPTATKPAARPAKGKTAPVIQAPPNVHAQRPIGSTPAAAPPLALVAPPPVKPPDNKGTVTGNPLPRWAALRSDEVNLRVGPGTRFPIEWQYHRRDLPVQILREVEVWRLIEDQDGVKGWVHQATLVGHRGFVVKGTEATLRHSASDDASPVAHLKPGVVGRLRSCEAGAAWCDVQVGDYRGWLRREQFYGADPGEAVGG
jgi:SH3-like domain-containing protein